MIAGEPRRVLTSSIDHTSICIRHHYVGLLQNVRLAYARELGDSDECDGTSQLSVLAVERETYGMLDDVISGCSCVLLPKLQASCRV